MRNYPLFVIDRSRRSKTPAHQHDYIVCLDKKAGYIGRIILLERVAFDELKSRVEKIEGSEYSHYFKLLASQKKGLVLLVEELLNPSDFSTSDNKRLKSLLKRGIDKYLYAEVAEVVKSEQISIEYQIKVQQDILKDLQAGYSKLEAHMGSRLANQYISCVKATINILNNI